MAGRLLGPNLSFECRILDIREMDAGALLASTEVGDNILAVLAGATDLRDTVRRVLTRIAGCAPGERARALTTLTLLAGLRQLEETIEQEARQMPILDDVLDNKVLGREYRRGELAVLLRLSEKRFGPVPSTAREKLAAMSAAEMEFAALRLLDAEKLDDLFG